MEKITKTRLGFQCQTLASYLYLTKSFGFMFNPRPAVLTIESILVGDNCPQDNCYMRECLCDSCP